MTITVDAPAGCASRVWSGPVMVLAGGVCIGFAPIGLRLGLGDLGPQAIAFWRYMFALPLLFAIILVVQRRLPARPNPFVLVAGTCFALDMALWHWALTYTSVANATFIVNLGNLGVGLVAWVFLKERPSAIWGIAVMIALGGAAALSIGSAGRDGIDPVLGLRGDLLALAAAVLVSGYMLASKVARRNLGGLDTIFWLTVVEIFVAAILVNLFGEGFLPAGVAGFAAPFALAVLVQVMGQGLIITGLGHTPAAIAGLLVIIQPVVAAGLSWTLFNERLSGLQLGGCILIMCGIVLAQLKIRQSCSKTVTSPG